MADPLRQGRFSVPRSRPASCQPQHRPVDWQRLRGERTFRDIFRAARDHGISEQGLTVPVRGPYGDVGLFSVTRNCSDREWDLLKAKILGELQTAAVHLHDNVIHSHALTRKLHHPSLSAREVEILQWIAAGKSQQDVADILSISNRTVEVHLRSGRSKLGALTTPRPWAAQLAWVSFTPSNLRPTGFPV